MEIRSSALRSGTLFGVMLISSALAAAPDTPRLSPAQASVVAKEIAKLRYPEERALASGWSDAKKAAEFICRPLATQVLKRRYKNADRVFLGTDDPDTLHLVSDAHLEGSGQVRTGDHWRAFTLSCVLNPRTGKAVSFETGSSSSATSPPAADAPKRPRWQHYFGPGPVRSPTFNPESWPGAEPRQK